MCSSRGVALSRNQYFGEYDTKKNYLISTQLHNTIPGRYSDICFKNRSNFSIALMERYISTAWIFHSFSSKPCPSILRMEIQSNNSYLLLLPRGRDVGLLHISICQRINFLFIHVYWGHMTILCYNVCNKIAEFIYINISIHQEAFYITEHTINWLFLSFMKEQINKALVCTKVHIKSTNFHFINTNSFYWVINSQN